MGNQFAARLTELLGLRHPPIAVNFHQRVPQSPPRFAAPLSEPTADGRTGRVPASCVFWIEAEMAGFLTVPEDHGNCSVGKYVHGLAEAEEIIDKADLATLLDTGWVTMDAFAGVARREGRAAAIEYSPLDQAAGEPEVVLMRLQPRQMMQVVDALPGISHSGKPQCQIVALAAAGKAVMSMGCALSRARTGMGEEEMTFALPGNALAELVAGLEKVCAADSAVSEYGASNARRF